MSHAPAQHALLLAVAPVGLDGQVAPEEAVPIAVDCGAHIDGGKHQHGADSDRRPLLWRVAGGVVSGREAGGQVAEKMKLIEKKVSCLGERALALSNHH